jgi:uncharacterized protein (TIGR02001 family)
MAAEYNASVGVVSNSIERGVTQSRDGISVNGDFGVKFDNGLFANYQPATIDFGDSTSIKHQVFLGYTVPTSLTGPVKVSVGTYTRLFTGGKGVGTPSDRNFTEAFVKLGYAGFTADLYKTVDDSKTPLGYNSYASLGYSTKLISNLSGSISTGYTHYATTGTTKHTVAEVGLTYGLTKNVNLLAGYSFGDHDASNAKLADKGYVGLNAGF